MVVINALTTAVTAARIAYPSARVSCPDGGLTIMSMSPDIIKPTTVGSPSGPAPSECLRTGVAGIPLRRSTATVPSVADTSKPSETSLETASTIARLSSSATETKTLPEVGNPPKAPACELENASGKVTAKPKTSPVERISGTNTVTTARPTQIL